MTRQLGVLRPVSTRESRRERVELARRAGKHTPRSRKGTRSARKRAAISESKG